eukprot:TRINITY_DN13740_c0_g1_i3.p1 TRINITY_DN13740_c0_g1~~TRINITY_DN13740_c0_g1_i3.p1  ORF type:complete len:243 (-),score=28.02 TRINITY_DN13740_c0_g1_i3:29-667(-)
MATVREKKRSTDGAIAESRGVEAKTAPSGDVGTAISETANVGQASSGLPELENVKLANVGMADVGEKKHMLDLLKPPVVTRRERQTEARTSADMSCILNRFEELLGDLEVAACAVDASSQASREIDACHQNLVWFLRTLPPGAEAALVHSPPPMWPKQRQAALVLHLVAHNVYVEKGLRRFLEGVPPPRGTSAAGPPAVSRHSLEYSSAWHA